MAFLLVVVVNNEVISDDKMLFKNIYRCNLFAKAIEQGKTSAYNRPSYRQQNITAYCIPKRVSENEVFYD
tara:strand:- start:318 stop:527 length:210 start_codon:yes stop_codon:yes gene_type:complete